MTTPSDVRELLDKLLGQTVWFVNAGGGAGSSFSLSLGRRILREAPLRNPSVTDEFRKNGGEFTLYIWCTWRLELADALASSDQGCNDAQRQLQILIGKSVERVEVTGRCFDLQLVIGGVRLSVFCDHVPPEPSFGSNWELVVDNLATLVAGPGFAVELTGEAQS